MTFEESRTPLYGQRGGRFSFDKSIQAGCNVTGSHKHFVLWSRKATKYRTNTFLATEAYYVSPLRSHPRILAKLRRRNQSRYYLSYSEYLFVTCQREVAVLVVGTDRRRTPGLRVHVMPVATPTKRHARFLPLSTRLVTFWLSIVQ